MVVSHKQANTAPNLFIIPVTEQLVTNKSDLCLNKMESSQSVPLLSLRTVPNSTVVRPHVKYVSKEVIPNDEFSFRSASTYAGYAFILFASICIAVSLTIFRYLQVHQYLSSTQVAFLVSSFLLVFASTWLIVGIWRQSISPTVSSSAYVWLAVRGTAGALCMTFLMISLKYISIGDCDTILFIAPIITIFLSKPLLGETVTYTHIFAALFGLSGSLIVARPSHEGHIAQVLASDQFIGSVFAFAAAIANAIVLISIRKIVVNTHFMFPVLSLGIFGVSITYCLGGAVSPSLLFQNHTFLVLSFTAAASFFTAQVAYCYGSRQCPASTGCIIQNIEIPTAYLLAVLILHDEISSYRLLGALLVVTGSIIVPLAKFANSLLL